jgi:hypothetical protein
MRWMALTKRPWLAAFLLLAGTVQAANKVEILDVTTPRGDGHDAISGPLEMITYATNDMAAVALFYKEGFGLELEGPLEINPASKSVQRELWGMPADIDWQEYRLTRPGLMDMPRVRVLLMNKPEPAIHNSWSAMEPGPFSIGFPNAAPMVLDKRLRSLGFGAQGEINRSKITRPDGVQYEILETIFNGPDFTKGVAVSRNGPGISQLSPVDPSSGLGGPAYSGVVVADMDAMLNFLSKILDMEIRGDRVWETSGALGAPAGTKYRFCLVYGKGSTHGHLLLLQYLNQPLASAREPVLPNRGIVSWTFKSTNLEKILARARKAQVEIRGPKTMELAGFGQRRVAMLKAPNGFWVELIEGL